MGGERCCESYQTCGSLTSRTQVQHTGHNTKTLSQTMKDYSPTYPSDGLFRRILGRGEVALGLLEEIGICKLEGCCIPTGMP